MPSKKIKLNKIKSVNLKASAKRSVAKVSYDTRTIVTVLLLLFVYPIGVIFMWAWMNDWPVWLKVIITLPVLVFIFAVFSIMFILKSAIRNVTDNRAWILEQSKSGRLILPKDLPHQGWKTY